MINQQFRTLVLASLFVIMMGWVVYIGQGIIMPIVAGLISATVLFSAAEALQRVPIIGHTPAWFRRTLVLLIFIAAVALFGLVLAANVQKVIATLPEYQHNLNLALADAAHLAGLESVPNWHNVWGTTVGRLDLRDFIVTVLSSTTSLGGQIFMVVLYASFLLAERAQFSTKLLYAMTSREDAQRVLDICTGANKRIGEYLAIKTLINIILGLVSYVIMWLLGIDYALFWAIFIGLLNYIPYFGALLGVVFPVALSLAQYGYWSIALASLITLSAAQMYVGNILEPRMVGRSLNLSPFVVLVALSVWSALWGLAGAILAVPMTAAVVSILAEIKPTRPLAIMLSSDGNVGDPSDGHDLHSERSDPNA